MAGKTALIEVGGVVVHQLLPGREIANRRKNRNIDGMTDRNWEFALTMSNVVYLIVDHRAKEALVFDGAWDVDGIFDYAEKIGVKIVGALYSHGHYDHVGGVIPTDITGGVQLIVSGIKDFIDRDVPAWVGEKDVVAVCLSCQVSTHRVRIAEPGEVVQVGSTQCTIYASPGHTAGSIALYVPPGGSATSSAGLQGERITAPDGVLLTGDTLFVEETGRTDLPESNETDLMMSLSLFCNNLPDNTIVCPGHNYSSWSHTTLGWEKKKNRLVMAGLSRFKTPGKLPPACCSGHWRTARELVKDAALIVRSLGGGELALDGIPFAKATAINLKEMVIEHIKAFDGKGKGKRNLPAASSLRLSDGSGKVTLDDGDSLFDPSFVESGLMVYGAELPKAYARRPWFETGSKVLVEGLRSAQELNGKRADILAWDYDKERYEVQFEGMADRKSLKADNMKLLAVEPDPKGKRPGKGRALERLGMSGSDIGFQGKGPAPLDMASGMSRGTSVPSEWLLDVDDDIDAKPEATVKSIGAQPAVDRAKGRGKGKGQTKPSARQTVRTLGDPGHKIEAECWRIVFKDKVAVRAAPSTKARVLGAKMPGSRVYASWQEGGWLRLHPEMYPGKEAWMLIDGRAQGHGILLEQEIETWKVVYKDKVVVRNEPAFTGSMLSTRLPGDVVKVSYCKGDWVRLHSSEGLEPQAAWMLVDGSAKGLGVLLKQIGTEELDAEASIDLHIPAGEKLEAKASVVDNAQPPRVASPAEPAADPAAEIADIQIEISELKMDKAQAVEEEDYDLAAELNARLKAAEARLQDLQGALQKTSASPASKLRELDAELQRLVKEKEQAVEEEEYDVAAEIKKKIKGVQARIAEIQAVVERAAREQDEVRREIEQVKVAKAQAVEDEDFKAASMLKTREKELDAKLKELMSTSA